MKNPKPEILVSQDLQRIFNELLNEIEKTSGQRLAVSMVVFNAEPGGRINYISNANRVEVVSAWTSLINAWQSGMPDIPAHVIN